MTLRFISAALASAFLVSCGEDPELLKKSRDQQLEITQLRGELALLEEKLRNLPPDKSEELALAKEQAKSQEAEIQSIEAEISKLETRRKELDDEFESYRRKYPVE